MTTQERITSMLNWVQRPGMDKLIRWLEREGYFTAPAGASTHSVYDGGLADHSLRVYNYLNAYNTGLPLGLERDTIIITALLHDVCKVGLYIGGHGRYKTNKAQPEGHGGLSLSRVQDFLAISELEEKMIFYHMGVYGTKEYDPDKGEYPLRGGGLANAWFHFPPVKIIYFADELATIAEGGHVKLY